MDFTGSAKLLLEGMIPGSVAGNFADWVGEIVEKSLLAQGLTEWGTVFVPQFGDRAGTFVTHSANQTKRESRINEQITKAMESPEPEKSLRRVQSIYGVQTVLIEKNFTSPIGVIWYVVSENATQIEENVQLFADFLSIIVLNDKYKIAFDLLAQNDWSDVSKYDKTFQTVAENCKAAIHCADVTIWLRRSNDLLKSVGTTSSGKVDMHVGSGLAGNIYFHKDPVVINRLTDKSEVAKYAPNGIAHTAVVDREKWRSACFIPLHVGGERIGIAAIYSNRFMGINNVDKAIAVVFCQKLCTNYTQVTKLVDLQNMEKKLRAIAPTISTSLVSMAQVHDAKNILNFLQSEISNITSRNERDKQSINYVSGSLCVGYVSRLQKILKRIGDHTKATSNRRDKIDIAIIVGEIFDFASKTTDANIKFVNEIPKRTIVKCDGIAIERLITNLVANSVYFLEDDPKSGERYIEAKLQESDSDFVVFTIFDNGMGIPRGSIDKLFEYTYTSKPNEGMGFGLAISKQIVLAHGGDLVIDSELGEWTIATVVLPTKGMVVELDIDAVLGGDVF